MGLEGGAAGVLSLAFSSDMTTNPQSTIELTVGEGQAGDRLDRFLALALQAEHPGLSRSRLKTLIEEGQVSLGGATIREPSRTVKPGERVLLSLPAVKPAKPAAQAIPLEVLFEDDQVIVLVKPAGLVVHPAPGNQDQTLVNALIAHCGPSLTGIGGVERPGIVHRLDKDTSGVMVAAKTALAQESLTRQFADRTIERRYLALVWGTPSPPAGEISGNIARSHRDRKKMTVVRQGGKAAVTRYRLVKSLAGGKVSLIECRLLTGRTHQIRVHLTAKGHPLLGDQTYGKATPQRLAGLPAEARATLAAFKRQALHAASLGFIHPESKEFLLFEADMPEDHKRLLYSLEKT